MSIDVLAKVVQCPKCKRQSASCYFGSVHLRWCLYCHVSWTVHYDKNSKKYKRSKVRKGLVFPDASTSTV
jgi:hypothetical protein